MRIASYNVNGIRAAIKKGLIDFLKIENFDIVCIQETKAHPDQVDMDEFYDLGYQAYWHSADKKGYSGVLTLSKIKMDLTLPGIDQPKYDSEGRVIRTDFEDWTLLNCYFPSGSASEERHEFKQEFLADFRKWVKNLKKERPNIIIVGDYNIVNTELDIHNPTRKDNPSGYRPEEREWLTEWFDTDFTDSFRYVHGEEIAYSWWSYRAGSRDKDKGWRIDYISVTKDSEDLITDAGMYKDDKQSDHCAIFVDIDIEV